MGDTDRERLIGQGGGGGGGPICMCISNIDRGLPRTIPMGLIHIVNM